VYGRVFVPEKMFSSLFGLLALLLLVHGNGAQPPPDPSVFPIIFCWFPHSYGGLSRDISLVLGYATPDFQGGHIDAPSSQNNIVPPQYTNALPEDFPFGIDETVHVLHGVSGWLWGGNSIDWTLNGTVASVDLSFILNTSNMCRNKQQFQSAPGSCRNYGNASFDWVDFCSDGDYCTGRERCVPFQISSQTHEEFFNGLCSDGEPVVCPDIQQCGQDIQQQCDNATESCVPVPTVAPTPAPTESHTGDRIWLIILLILTLLALLFFCLYMTFGNMRRRRTQDNKTV
jgi:hypothetical protein